MQAAKALISPIEALQSASDYFNLAGRSSLFEESEMETTGHSEKESYLISKVGITSSGQVPCRLGYIQNSKRHLDLVWDLEIDVKSGDNWYNVQVSALTGEILTYVDWVSHAIDPQEVESVDISSRNDALANAVPQYAGYGFGVTSPLRGSRTLYRNASDPIASPRGWQRIGNLIYLTTQGNNVRAQENYDGSLNWESKYRPNGGYNMSFVFPVDLNKGPRDNQDSAIRNLFLWNNLIHDIFYYYGFTEKSGNFQDENFGRGGLGNDGVIANAQDGTGTNNANFATPPDGSRPRMRMYVWTFNTPNRDGDLESPIIIHEYGHGISMRLTGGSASSGCLASPESAGMGEGWSDFFGLVLHMKPSYNVSTTLLMGDYVFNGKTIRKFPYSSNFNISKPGMILRN